MNQDIYTHLQIQSDEVLVIDPQDYLHRQSQLSVIAEDNVNENLMTTQRFNNFNLASQKQIARLSDTSKSEVSKNLLMKEFNVEIP